MPRNFSFVVENSPLRFPHVTRRLRQQREHTTFSVKGWKISSSPFRIRFTIVHLPQLQANILLCQKFGIHIFSSRTPHAHRNKNKRNSHAPLPFPQSSSSSDISEIVVVFSVCLVSLRNISRYISIFYFIFFFFCTHLGLGEHNVPFGFLH